jgi:hypothetical protein
MSKKKKVTKKPSKKAASRSAKTTHEVVVRVESAPVRSLALVPTVAELTEPMRDGQKLTIPKTWMSEKQITWMMQVTPKQHVYQRQGKGGKTFDYVTGAYVEKVLNFIFGWNWDFEVTSHGREGNFVWVLGKLTVRGGQAGQVITKTQFGRAEIKYIKNTKDYVDYGNDLKAATTDALKKCASLLGIASDIYGKAEFKQETGKEAREESVPASPQPVVNSSQPEYHECHGCAQPISREVAEYSKKVYKKKLCATCQKQS